MATLQESESSEKRLRAENQGEEDDDSTGAHLHDDIVTHILSFLPIKEAILMGLLATSFKTAWRHSRKLCFDKEFARNRKRADIVAIVDKVFANHAGPIDSFELFIAPNHGDNQLIEAWINHAIENQVKELDLNFSVGRGGFTLPSDLFNAEAIRVLKLSNCLADLPENLTGLKYLHTVVFRKIALNKLFVDRLFYNCACLESLDIAYCYTISCLRIFSSKQKRFKVLKIGNCTNLTSIHIDSPTLTKFHYRGQPRIFNLTNVPQLNDVVLFFIPSGGIMASHEQKLVYDISFVQTLAVSSSLIEGLSVKVIGNSKTFCFWNLKELQLIMEGATFCNLLDVVNFLKACPCVEALFIDFTDFVFDDGLFWKYHQQPLFEQFHLVFYNLKTVKLTGFKFQEKELMLVKFLLENSICLEKLVVVTHRTTRDGRYWVFPPYAETCMRRIRGWKSSPEAEVELYYYCNDKSQVKPMQSKSWY